MFFYLTQYINPLSFQYNQYENIINDILDILGFVFGTATLELSIIYTYRTPQLDISSSHDYYIGQCSHKTVSSHKLSDLLKFYHFEIRVTELIINSSCSGLPDMDGEAHVNNVLMRLGSPTLVSTLGIPASTLLCTQSQNDDPFIV